MLTLFYIHATFTLHFLKISVALQVLNTTQERKIEKKFACSKIIDAPLGLPHENAHIIAKKPLALVLTI